MNSEQFNNFKQDNPNGGVKLETTPVSNSVVIVKAEVYTNYPNTLLGSSQALVDNLNDFDEAQDYVISEALNRSGYPEVLSEQQAEVQSVRNSEEKPKKVETTAEESEVINAPEVEVTEEKQESAKDVMAKYSHLLK